jgi:hypothetical protein
MQLKGAIEPANEYHRRGWVASMSVIDRVSPARHHLDAVSM